MNQSILTIVRFMVATVGLCMAMAAPARAIDFRLVGQLDTAALNAGVPGSIAAYGNDVYVGGLFTGGQLHHITNPLSSPMNVNTFGALVNPGATTNGYVTLDTNGTTLVAATNNGGGSPDFVKVYTFGTDALNWESDSAALGIMGSGGDRIDGAAVDPKTGEVLITAFGNGDQNLYLPTGPTPMPGTADPTPSILFDNSTGWRDLDYNSATGDLYLRATVGINKGIRVNPATHDYTRPDGFGAGIQEIVDIDDGFDSAINLEFLPASFAGQDLLIVNRRVNPNTFAAQIELYDPNVTDSSQNATPISANFFLADGVTPFTTANASSGIYDFSYDPINDLLYISDFSSSQVHIFDVGGPTMPACDFNGDNMCNGADIDLLVANIAIGPPDPTTYDLTNDNMVNLADRDAWLSQAGVMNLPSQNAYLLGDANLDGVVDGQDFIAWNTNKFMSLAAWTGGDFNADGVVDGQDFIVWNTFKFQSADAATVPEPAAGFWLLLMGLAGFRRRA